MIDFHCHLDLYPEKEGLIKACHESRAYILSVTTTPKAWHGNKKLTEKYDRIRVALGLHPQLVHERFNELSLFDALLPEAKYVGEIGLDGSREYKQHLDIQQKAFSHILEQCTLQGGRILSVHSRGAVDKVLDAIEQYPDAGTPVLHWFSGTLPQLHRAISLNCWFSVGPAMLKSQKGRLITEAIPKSRLLTESDGPFGTARGKPLSPLDMEGAEAELAMIWRMTRPEVGALLRQNLASLCREIV